MFECPVLRGGSVLCRQLGLNEVAVQAGPPFRILDIDLYVDSELVTTYSCDGLIVSTPVGSTAHSLSAGGPILRKDLQAFVILPISPHTLTNRPVVDSADRVYELVVAEPERGNVGGGRRPRAVPLAAGRPGARRAGGGALQAGRRPGPQLLPHLAREARLGRAIAAAAATAPTRPAARSRRIDTAAPALRRRPIT